MNETAAASVPVNAIRSYYSLGRSYSIMLIKNFPRHHRREPSTRLVTAALFMPQDRPRPSRANHRPDMCLACNNQHQSRSRSTRYCTSCKKCSCVTQCSCAQPRMAGWPGLWCPSNRHHVAGLQICQIYFTADTMNTETVLNKTLAAVGSNYTRSQNEPLPPPRSPASPNCLS